MATGSAMAIVPSREQILESLPIVKPTLICSVPTLFNKVIIINFLLLLYVICNLL